MTDLEKAHLTELTCLARGRGATDAEIAAVLRAEADRLHPANPDTHDQEDRHG
jgi:hypothetical protein